MTDSYSKEIIKRKLLFDGDGTGEDRRINQFLKMAAKYCFTEESQEEATANFDRLLFQVDLIELNYQKSCLVHAQNNKQLEIYENMQAELAAKVKEKKLLIAEAHVALDKAKKIRDNRIHYDMIAKAIKKETPRTELLKKQETLDREIQELQVKKERLNVDIDERKKQFMVLSSAAHNLIELLVKREKDPEDVEQDPSE